MPGRNIVKQFGADQYYHVYSRGVAKQKIFLDDQDYQVFISLFKRYLSLKAAHNPRHGIYPHFRQRAQLLAYCLMPNHVHLLIHQSDATAMTELLKAILTSYGMYFNKKYKRVGPVFQSRYKASHITTESYLEHISRYIHLNPSDWQSYAYSSLPYYLNKRSSEWLTPEPIMSIFENSAEQYLDFMKDYHEHKHILDELKWELANY